VVNEINGLDHRRCGASGTPAIFGMNFQTVSTAEKLPFSDAWRAGYLAGGVTPDRLLTKAFDYINTQGPDHAQRHPRSRPSTPRGP